MPAPKIFSAVTGDLNAVGLVTDTTAVQPLADPSTRNADGSVEVVFRNIEQRLIDEIRTSKVVMGCVAWLTSGPILDALAEVQGVSIVVQKEDFLRPDIDAAGREVASQLHPAQVCLVGAFRARHFAERGG